MENKRPLILISNDDGFDSKGIAALIEAVRSLGDIIVMAPDGPRSGAAGAITSQVPIHVKLVKKEEGLTVYKCTGTPVDCVKLALHDYVPRTPDLVLGGINHGDNSSVNVHYSGTMGVVIEGCLKGIPSIGFSLCNHDWNADFTATLPFVRSIAHAVMQHGLSEGCCLNVNIPDGQTFKGVRLCRQTRGTWRNEFVKHEHPRGGNYYWLTGAYENFEPHATDTDHWALEQGYIAVTPTQIDVTAYNEMNRLSFLNQTV